MKALVVMVIILAKIMVVDEGVRFLPAPQPRTDGTIFDQMVAEYGYNPLAA